MPRPTIDTSFECVLALLEETVPEMKTLNYPADVVDNLAARTVYISVGANMIDLADALGKKLMSHAGDVETETGIRDDYVIAAENFASTLNGIAERYEADRE